MYAYQNVKSQENSERKAPSQAKTIGSQPFLERIVQREERREEQTNNLHTVLSDRLRRPAENRTGLPDRLKSGVEALSGFSLDDVRVHYHSPKPAQLQAYAYTRGTEIYVAPGQEKHLSHEAWHVVQQKQGRVRPTGLLRGVGVNDDERLEREADIMGRKSAALPYAGSIQRAENRSSAVQCASDWKTPSLESQSRGINPRNGNLLQKVIHHMLPRKLLEDFCACLSPDQQEKIKNTFAPNPDDRRSSIHRILKSLRSNLVVGPNVSARLDDEDHLKGPRGEQPYFSTQPAEYIR